MNSKVLGVHHVAINVDDFDRAIGFYRGTLGLEVRKDRPELGVAGAWLDVGGQQVHLVEAPPPPNVGQHFALRVADLGQVIDELRAQGVEVSDPIEIGPSRQAFLQDPSGNTIELNQPGS